MIPRLRSRSKLVVAWIVFGAVTLLAAAALWRLHRTTQAGLREQSAETLKAERARILAEVRAIAGRRRSEVIKALASFHVEGLAHALRKWDETEAGIVGTFQWDGERGFLPGSVLSPGLAQPEEMVALWQDFRVWRKQHPDAARAGPRASRGYATAHFRLNGDAEFPTTELGYQGENLEILVYAKRPVDPWAGWAGSLDDPRKPWVIWYQAGPDAPIRGCYVAVAPLIEELRRGLVDRSVTHSGLRPAQEAGDVAPRAERVALAEWLPAWVLQLEEGDIFIERQNSARLAVLVVALLLAVFLVGVALLTLLSRREIRDAARKATFVAQVSHELRTPLTSIRMFADLLATPALAEEKRAKYAGSISRESERLSGLIERLLMFNAIERGRSPAAVARVEVGPVISETLEEMGGALRAAGLEIECQLPAKSLAALTDASVLKQALLSLLDNAVKYAADGKIVRVTASSARDKIYLRVSDEGPGIPRGLGERAFEPFVQGNATLTGKSPGVGLGLSIARGLLRQAGGDLVLLPSATGACFEIQLPAAP